MGLTPVMIVLDQKWNIKKLSKMFFSKPCGIQRVKDCVRCIFASLFWKSNVKLGKMLFVSLQRPFTFSRFTILDVQIS